MSWTGAAIGFAGTAMLFKLGHPVLGGIAAFFAFLQFWFFGVTHTDREPEPDKDHRVIVYQVAWFYSLVFLIVAAVIWFLARPG